MSQYADPTVPLTEADAIFGEQYHNLFVDYALLQRMRIVQAGTAAVDAAVDAAEAAQEAAEIAQAAAEAVQHTFVVDLAYIADDVASVRLVPAGVNGTLVSARYDRVAAPSSAAGDIILVVEQGDGADITAPESIDGAAATDLTLADDGAFVDGLTAKITSDNADATGGTRLQISGVYTITPAA